MSDIVKRLRERADLMSEIYPHEEEAADLIELQREALRAAREAIEQFACEATRYDPPESDDNLMAWDTEIRIGHLRDCRTAVAVIDAALKEDGE